MPRQTLLVLAALSALAGCGEPRPEPHEETDPIPCHEQPLRQATYYLGPGMTLVLGPGVPAAGEVEGNDFTEAFGTNDLAPWLGNATPGMHLLGNVSLEFWARMEGPGAPPDPDNPGRSFLFYNQFGSDRTFQSGAAVANGPPAFAAGEVLRFNQTFQLPPGGFVLESGDRLRLLLTSAVADSQERPGTHILFGGSTPSALRFAWRCFETPEWAMQRYLRHPVVLPGNQGGPTGLIPPLEGVNRFTYDFTLENGTDRLRVFVRSPDATREPKTDVDVRLVDAGGRIVYDASSPYTDETFVLWHENLEALAPPGPYKVRVDVYGGSRYSGLLEVAMETGAVAHSH